MSDGQSTYGASTFEQFYAAEFSRVVSAVLPLAGSWAVAQELAQDAFVDAYRRWGTIAAYDRPELWVRRAAINRAASTFRRRNAERRALRRHGVDEAVELDSDNYAYAHLLRQVAALPRQQATAISLVYVDQLSVAEAAEVMDCSESTVRSHLEKGRNYLRASLAQEERA